MGSGPSWSRPTLQKDFASVQAVALILVAAFVVINGVVDLWSLSLDPRLRAKAVG